MELSQRFRPDRRTPWFEGRETFKTEQERACRLPAGEPEISVRSLLAAWCRRIIAAGSYKQGVGQGEGGKMIQARGPTDVLDMVTMVPGFALNHPIYQKSSRVSLGSSEAYVT